MIYNPDKPLRTAYLGALQTALGIPVYANGFPKPELLVDKYVLISTQTKVRTAIAKPTAASGQSDNFDWLSSITFDVNAVSPVGYANPGAVDDIMEKIINAAETLAVAGWCIKSRVCFNTNELNVATPTNYVNRKVITYQHWIQKL